MGNLDGEQVRRAVVALLKHTRANKSSGVGKPSLLEIEGGGDGEEILAQLSLHKIPSEVSIKPIPIAIPHPLRQEHDCEMCLFVKDGAKARMKDVTEAEPLPGLAKIIELQKLRTQYRDFKNRRELLAQFDLFLADDRILPMLTKALGKTFIKAKKQPIPVKLERRSSLGKQIERARSSAFFCGSYGDCWAAKLASTAMTEDQVVENLMTGIDNVVGKIPRKWKNVKAINIKASSSVALPVYNNLGDIPSESATVRSAPDDNGAPGADNRAGKDNISRTDHTTRKPPAKVRRQLRKLKKESRAVKMNEEAVDARGVPEPKKTLTGAENVNPIRIDEPSTALGGKKQGQVLGHTKGAIDRNLTQKKRKRPALAVAKDVERSAGKRSSSKKRKNADVA